MLGLVLCNGVLCSCNLVPGFLILALVSGDRIGSDNSTKFLTFRFVFPRLIDSTRAVIGDLDRFSLIHRVLVSTLDFPILTGG